MAGETLWEYVQLIIGVIVVILVISIVNKPLSAAESSNKGTRVSFGSMMSVLANYDRDGGAMPGVSFVPGFFIEDGFYVVAFDADEQVVTDTCAETKIDRPKECSLGKACICLCYEGKPCKDNYPDCKTFNQIKRISVKDIADDNFIGERKMNETMKTHLLVYGDCGVGSSALRPINLYFSVGSGKDREILLSGTRPS